MFNSKRMKDDLIRDEGYRDKIYTDTVGKISVGIGRNLTDVGVSADEIDKMYENDLGRAILGLDNNANWWRSLDDVRQRVLINMSFNLGSRLFDFNQMLASAKNKDWERASSEMLNSKWAKQVGNRAIRLATMMRTGEDI